MLRDPAQVSVNKSLSEREYPKTSRDGTENQDKDFQLCSEGTSAVTDQHFDEKKVFVRGQNLMKTRKDPGSCNFVTA